VLLFPDVGRSPKKAHDITAARPSSKTNNPSGVGGGDFSHPRISRCIHGPDRMSACGAFNTIPMPGGPGSESWAGTRMSAARGGGSVWVLGCGQLRTCAQLVYTARALRSRYYGDDREGDTSLYCSSLAGRRVPRTIGNRKWQLPLLLARCARWDSAPKKKKRACGQAE